VRKCRGDHTFLTIDDEEPIDKCDRKGEESSSKKERKGISYYTEMKVEISRKPKKQDKEDSCQYRGKILRKYERSEYDK
jgi:hypothetical protein